MSISETSSLGVHVDDGDIQGQGTEGQQPCHHGSGQQRCPAAQRTKVDEGPVGKYHNEGRRTDNLPPFGPNLQPCPAHSMTKAL